MVSMNRADHEFASYDDPTECGLHLAVGHRVPGQSPYQIDQHWGLHFHPTDSAPDPDQDPPHEPARQEWADDAGSAATAPEEALGGLLRLAGLRLVADRPDRPGQPRRPCPHCGNPLVILTPAVTAATVETARREALRAMLRYQEAVGEIIGDAWPLNPDDLDGGTG